jgi:dipeptidyl aminopeptidase/acylaminoacyl peptidase
MRRVSFASLFLCLAAASFGAPAAWAAPSADVYGNPPDYDSPLISPDGKHVAVLAPLGENGGVKVIKLGGGPSCGFAPSTVKVRSAFWVNSQRIAVRVSFFFSDKDAPKDQRYQHEIFRYVTMNTDCREPYEVLRDHPDYGILGGFSYVSTFADGSNMLFAALSVRRMSGLRPSVDIFKVDAQTGKGEKIENGMPSTIGWIADGTGQLRLRIDEDDQGRSRAFARFAGSNDWTLAYDSGSTVDLSRKLSFEAIGDQPDIAYVTTANGGDKNAVYEYNLRTKSLGRLIFQHPKVDVGGVVLDSNTDRPVGTSYVVDYPTAEYFDPTYQQMKADLAETFPGEHVSIVSAANDKKKYVARVDGSQNPTGTYYLVDMTAPSIGKLGARYGSISAADVGKVISFSYQARDGMTIPAYLTLPPGSSGKNLPLVVLPHGGPHARDTAAFDPWPQFLASRGYAVLQPQFRGSAGFGTAHLKAGHYKWGLEMQDDLTDGLKHLIANGTADASKVCIYGWSYGGYAAMAGLAFTPQYYKCGVAGAGLSDLLLFLGDSKRKSQSRGEYWSDYIGSPLSDRDRLIATSPIKHVSQIKAPLLLIHPKDDTVVPLRQSTLMAQAMRAAGKEVEYIELEGDDHWLSKASTSKRVLRELEAFLAKHLK